ncbi:transcriptional regulator GcvA [Denitrobaculum tricleocarpae]|uniref:Transcriptional regulator GcvA n=1 Tax=Denitrobaculum tricleocarpae TaxID=2591009 RepID=A0A545TP61_9PROT|nr:transcriptional regulator GcvA [Denitrobaculum tricleocarpae]TQV78968.1 transcriptional regulator GcvA [Denitrobaculum tricleocarpae]
MVRKLPPLNALRAFEAAARHLSFTKAAEELFVTQAAVSHQIKTLEAHLGIQLFRRLNRRLLLTEAGQDYFPVLRDALDMMNRATQRLRSQDSSGNLKVSALPSFAAKWLLPRLPRFTEKNPTIDVLISANDQIVDFDQDDFDLAIRYGSGNYPGLRVDRMMGDRIFPVCSPRLLEGDKPLQAPDDLSRHVLLHDDMARTDASANDWQGWLRAAGITTVDPDRGPAYSHSSMVIQAAIEGHGIALGRTSLIGDDVAAGRLVCPFGPVIPGPFTYYLVGPEETADQPKIQAFKTWIQQEVAAFSYPETPLHCGEQLVPEECGPG